MASAPPPGLETPYLKEDINFGQTIVKDDFIKNNPEGQIVDTRILEEF